MKINNKYKIRQKVWIKVPCILEVVVKSIHSFLQPNGKYIIRYILITKAGGEEIIKREDFIYKTKELAIKAKEE